MELLASDIAAAANGTLHGPDVPVDGASIDSRAVAKGQLFVAVIAERDGHDYVPSAFDAGAGAALVSRPVPGGTTIEVADTQEALTEVGRLARSRMTYPVIGITGSVGKTSVKDLAAAALAPSHRVHASDKSFNNEMGVPITLAGSPDDTEVAVVEMGARGKGHIAHLCSIGQPTIAVVTRVGAVHTELFGTLDQVAEAKGELVEALPESGTAVLNLDDHRVLAMSARTGARVMVYGLAEGDAWAEGVELDADLVPSFRLHLPDGSADVRLGVRGEHNVSNALAAAAVAHAAGATVASIATGLGTAALSPHRMAMHRTAAGALVIDDTYNANPMSMRAGIDALVASAADRRVAVLGVMGELGDGHDDEHAGVAAYAQERGVEVIAFQEPAYGLPAADDIADAVAMLGARADGDAVLVKGSRVAELERLVDALLEG